MKTDQSIIPGLLSVCCREPIYQKKILCKISTNLEPCPLADDEPLMLPSGIPKCTKCHSDVQKSIVVVEGYLPKILESFSQNIIALKGVNFLAHKGEPKN